MIYRWCVVGGGRVNPPAWSLQPPPWHSVWAEKIHTKRRKTFPFWSWDSWVCIYCRVLAYSLFSLLALCPVSTLRCPAAAAGWGRMLFVSPHSAGLEQKLSLSSDRAFWPSSRPQGSSTGAQPQAWGPHSKSLPSWIPSQDWSPHVNINITFGVFLFCFNLNHSLSFRHLSLCLLFRAE